VAAVPPSAVSADWKAGFLLPLRSNSRVQAAVVAHRLGLVDDDFRLAEGLE
jgi:hypothetical protein